MAKKARNKAEMARQLSEDLRQMLANTPAPKERKTFHRSTQTMGKTPEQENRADRRQAKRDLNRDY